MSRQSTPSPIATIGIDIGKEHLSSGPRSARCNCSAVEEFAREQFERRLANLPRPLIGMEVCSGALHIGRQPSQPLAMTCS